jgi:hypothetical protein
LASTTGSAPGKASVGRSHRRAAEALLSALEPFDKLRGWIPLRYITTFLMVALDEGKWPSAYARGASIDLMSMARCLRDLGEKSRRGGPGLSLVMAVRDASNPHRRKMFLTEKGRALLAGSHEISAHDGT